jgi:hypothetical protein
MKVVGAYEEGFLMSNKRPLLNTLALSFKLRQVRSLYVPVNWCANPTPRTKQSTPSIFLIIVRQLSFGL